MKWYICQIFLFTFFVISPLRVDAAKDDNTMHLFAKWKSIPTEQLDKIANKAQEVYQSDSAMTAFTIIANRYDKSKGTCEANRAAADALRHMGYIYQYQLFDYSLAYLNLQKSLDISLAEGYKENLPYIYLHFANIAYNDCQTAFNGSIYKKVMPLYRKALSAATTISRWDMYLNIMGNIYAMAFDLRHSIDMTEILGLFPRKGIDQDTPLYRYILCIHDALVANQEHRYEDALHSLDNAIPLCKQMKSSQYYYLRLVRHRASIYMDMGDYDKTIETLKERLSLAEHYGIEDSRIQTLKLIAYVYRKRGDEPNANRWQVTYYQQKDSFLRSSHLLRVDRIQLGDMLGKVNRYNTELQQRNHVQTAILGINYFVLVLVIFLLILLAISHRKLREKNRSLYISTQKILEREKTSKRERDKMNKLIQQEQEEPEPSTASDEKAQKYKSSTLTEEDKLRIYNKLIDVMNHDKAIFSSDFGIHQLAELTNVPSRHLSQVINEHFGHTFKTLLTRYRIREACHRLSDGHYSHLSIEGIAESVGFKSRSSFVQAFKRETGLSPSDYQKEALNS